MTTTTGDGSAEVELLEAISWLSTLGGIVLLQKDEIHVYRGAIHRCVVRNGESSHGVAEVVEAIKRVRAEHELGG